MAIMSISNMKVIEQVKHNHCCVWVTGAFCAHCPRPCPFACVSILISQNLSSLGPPPYTSNWQCLSNVKNIHSDEIFIYHCCLDSHRTCTSLSGDENRPFRRVSISSQNKLGDRRDRRSGMQREEALIRVKESKVFGKSCPK
ncbi:uncharacterized protein YALI1_A11345g [Yarrowia lipolytica]|uniref:Uncharacterized protein n=1 Tax=Yarrowia lipolytica TaxID=4952 RepID=A0A1D8N4G8_YARLL|nr:hypothetical protein YALI1_A11345g [Yarrowia lipolytica]